MNRHNFYDALLDQDGHRIEHVRPPRDLQSWQLLPVSAIANFHPAIAEDLQPAALMDILDRFPYQCFPVALNGRLEGILRRDQADASVAKSVPPNLEPATTCLRDNTIHEVQQLLIDSSTHLVVVLDRAGGKVVGLVTLHDLLRAEVSMAQQGQADI
jgi:CIC family chloride channel protein